MSTPQIPAGAVEGKSVAPAGSTPRSWTLEWRPVPIAGYEALYEVSNRGQVRSVRTMRLLSTRAGSNGYPRVHLRSDGNRREVMVHHLVAQIFIGPRPAGPDGEEIRHLDGNPLNNSAVNLAYGSKSQNRYDSVQHGTHNNASKTHCPQGHPYDGPNTRRYGVNGTKRRCRACHREDESRRRAARIGRAA